MTFTVAIRDLTRWYNDYCATHGGEPYPDPDNQALDSYHWNWAQKELCVSLNQIMSPQSNNPAYLLDVQDGGRAIRRLGLDRYGFFG